MEIRRIETGIIPTSITGGSNEKIKPIQPINPTNNERKPRPEWEIGKDAEKGKILDVRI